MKFASIKCFIHRLWFLCMLWTSQSSEEHVTISLMEDAHKHYVGKVAQKAVIERDGMILVCRGVWANLIVTSRHSPSLPRPELLWLQRFCRQRSPAALAFHLPEWLLLWALQGSDFSSFSGNVYILFLAAALWGICQIIAASFWS